jgi:hypothetical protein
VARCRNLFVATPLSEFRAPPQTGFRKTQLASACLREAASAKAGAFPAKCFVLQIEILHYNFKGMIFIKSLVKNQ